MNTTGSLLTRLQARESLTCTACLHPRGVHFTTFDGSGSGCAAVVPMPSSPMGEEMCICNGFGRTDQ